jgi:hypothetical protein
MKVTPSKPDDANKSDYTPTPEFDLSEAKHEGSGPAQTPEQQARHRAHTLRQDVMSDCLEERDRQEELGFDAKEDDTVPIYAWGKKINHQLNQASSGRGPFRKRYLRIMALAMAALESIDRKEQ